jgi:hypothetical protein
MVLAPPKFSKENFMTNTYEGAPLDAASDPNFNGAKASPGIPYVNRTPITQRVIDRLRERAQELGRPLTDNECSAIMKQG